MQIFSTPLLFPQLTRLMTNKQLVHAMVCQVVTNNNHMCTAKLTNINKVHHMVVNHV